ncbi:hypothetical protein SAMN05444359_10221 [Neolewinella agarilytica]|uniref:Uncharacterized protein n=2 Tax=Neolewinella agarilytica TaxID=478744 RepID=A0A1H9A9V4_9BACT|nr:hypothetical protein SAMN05444359_10221 [Neolewinella agarilytica]
MIHEILILLVACCLLTTLMKGQADPVNHDPSQYDLSSYQNQCNNTNPELTNDGWSVTAYFDDPDGDCISTRWVNIYQSPSGTFNIYDQNIWFHLQSTTEYDFGAPHWQCCAPSGPTGPVIGSNGGSYGGWTGSGEGFNSTITNAQCGCDYSISYDSDGDATITVNCNCIDEN